MIARARGRMEERSSPATSRGSASSISRSGSPHPIIPVEAAKKLSAEAPSWEPRAAKRASASFSPSGVPTLEDLVVDEDALDGIPLQPSPPQENGRAGKTIAREYGGKIPARLVEQDERKVHGKRLGDAFFPGEELKRCRCASESLRQGGPGRKLFQVV